MIVGHLSGLRAVEGAIDVDIAMTAVTDLLLAFPAAANGDAGVKAKARGYMTALEDLPAWAVVEACRRWLRGEAGDGNYDFAPSAPRLREIAILVRAPLTAHRIRLERLLAATPDPEYSDEHRAEMLKKVSELFKRIQKVKSEDAA